MVIKKHLAAGLVALLLTPLAHANADKCNELIPYRDGALYADLDRSFKRLDSAQKSLSLLQTVREDISSARSTQVTVNIAYQLTLAAKTVANVIGGILNISPATGKAMAVAKGSSNWVAAVINTATATELASQIKNGSLVEHIAIEITTNGSPIGAGLKTAYTFSKDIVDHKEQHKAAKEILVDLDRHLAQLERQLKKLNNKSRHNQIKIKAINIIKNEIDKACS
jgi:hypothetical protein